MRMGRYFGLRGLAGFTRRATPEQEQAWREERYVWAGSTRYVCKLCDREVASVYETKQHFMEYHAEE